MKVYVGIGHGGTDSGAVANGFKEKDLNLEIGTACADELKRHGVTVMLSRTVDETEKLNAKVAECNKFDPDYCLDIHNNAGGGDGAEVIHHSGGGNSKKLALNILEAICALGQNVHSTTPQKVETGLKTRVNSNGKDYFGFIRDTKAPAVIVECAFVDNKKDMQVIDTAAERKAMGKAIAKGVLKTLGITYKKEVTSVANKDNTPDKYAKDAIEWALKKGLLAGDEKGNFKLHSNITRQDLFVILYRYDMQK